MTPATMSFFERLREVPASPQFAVAFHTGAQAGAMVGLLIGPPIYYSGGEDEYYGESFSFAVSGIALKCAGIGIAASLVLFYFKTRDELNWIDLAARIQANAFQNHIDRLSIAGAAVGALVGAPTAFFAVSDVGRSEQRHIRVLRRAVRGAAVGCAIGVFASVFLFHRIASSSH